MLFLLLDFPQNFSVLFCAKSVCSVFICVGTDNEGRNIINESIFFPRKKEEICTLLLLAAGKE
jgi:hypothetical protein